jgi:hypothetical protein
MRKLALVLACLTLAFLATQARADGVIDPSIGIGDPSCNSYHDGPVQDVFTGFSFTANANGGGFFAFCNKTGDIWRSVDIRFSDPAGAGFIAPADIDCNNLSNGGPPPFDFCEAKLLAGNILDISFSITQTNSEGASGGIPQDAIMIVDLNDNSCIPTNGNNCNNNDGSWPSGLKFFGAGNGPATVPPVPEPASAFLLCSGAAALWRYRRWRS